MDELGRSPFVEKPIAGNPLLYSGEMTLLPHQGGAQPGRGTIELVCGGARRELRVRFRRQDGQGIGKLPSSKDGKYGIGTGLMRIPLSTEFFVFVTSTSDGELIGESQIIGGDIGTRCHKLVLQLVNCLLPAADVDFRIDDLKFSLQRTKQAYDLTRARLPSVEINLTHELTIKRTDSRPITWESVSSAVGRLLNFLSFVNCSSIPDPVCYGYLSGKPVFFRFESPERTIPTNRRTWATNLGASALQNAFSKFLAATKDEYRAEIFERAIGWQILAEKALRDSWSQPLSTTQMLLEMLSYVVLVEDQKVLSEDGYAKLPASDRIMLLCAQTRQVSDLPFDVFKDLKQFCLANSIINVGELISGIRNKLIHPTKKNREYLSKVPAGARFAAIDCGMQIASLSLLHIMTYKSEFFDVISHKVMRVPWADS